MQNKISLKNIVAVQKWKMNSRCQTLIKADWKEILQEKNEEKKNKQKKEATVGSVLLLVLLNLIVTQSSVLVWSEVEEDFWTRFRVSVVHPFLRTCLWIAAKYLNV